SRIRTGVWSRRPDSDRRPAVYKTAALPAELRRRAHRLYERLASVEEGGVCLRGGDGRMRRLQGVDRHLVDGDVVAQKRSDERIPARVPPRDQIVRSRRHPSGNRKIAFRVRGGLIDVSALIVVGV